MLIQKIFIRPKALEDYDITVGLYNKLKKNKIRSAREIPQKKNYENLEKKDLIEIIEKMAKF